MKTGNKIALFYSAITIGVIAVVTLVFYWVSTSYISRLYYSYLTEKLCHGTEALGEGRDRRRELCPYPTALRGNPSRRYRDIAERR